MMNLFILNKRFMLVISMLMVGLFSMPDLALAGYGSKSYYNGSYNHKGYNHGYGFKFGGYYNNHKGYRSTYKSNNGFYGHRSSRHNYNPYYYSERRIYRPRSYSYTSPYNSHGYVNKRSYKKYKYPYADYSNKHHYPKKVKHCYDYRVTSHGGRGGFRFQHNIDNFHKIDNRTFVSKICGRNSVEFELSKLDPSVSVSIEIAGKFFHYPAHSGHHKLINNWHRKYFSVSFGRH